MTQTILFKKLHPNAKTPHRASEHAAGFDLTAATTHATGNKVIVGTGIASAFAEDHVLLIFARSGYAFKHGIRLANGVAVIDADYRGEIMLAFMQDRAPAWNQEAIDLLAPGNRVAQAILMPIPHVNWEEIGTEQALPETIRGEGGLGSTGTR